MILAVMNWNISYIISHSFLTGLLEPINDQLPTSVASWLSWLEHRTSITRSRVQSKTLLKSWIFQASIHNCIHCIHICEDHRLLDLGNIATSKYTWIMMVSILPKFIICSIWVIWWSQSLSHSTFYTTNWPSSSSS